MTRRHRLAPRLSLTLALGLCAATSGGCERPFEPSWQERPPNLLLITVDTLRADHMGVYGYERPTTPRIDGWAEAAVVFENAHAASSWTLPGLASGLTSYYPTTHGCSDFASRLDPSFTTLTEILLDQGFDTACVTSHIFLARRYGLQQGFVHFDDEFDNPIDHPHDSITSHRVSDRGIGFLRQKAEAADDYPWFLWLHYFDPHTIYKSHEGISEAFGAEPIDLYDGEIAYTDLHIGRALDALEELGLAENTVVAFFSDHGEEFEEHGRLYHGHSLHGELVNVPLIVQAPGFQGRRVDGVVRTVDLLPTLLELLGLGVDAAPATIEGQSLVPAMHSGAANMRLAVSEVDLNARDEYVSLVHGELKLIVNIGSGQAQLFDLSEDPGELNDLGEQRPQVVADLKAELKRELERAQKSYGEYEHSGIDITPGEKDDMRNLGYLGDEEEPRR